MVSRLAGCAVCVVVGGSLPGAPGLLLWPHLARAPLRRGYQKQGAEASMMLTTPKTKATAVRVGPNRLYGCSGWRNALNGD